MVSSLRPGQIFAGFRIESRLGASGMGEVYLAHDPDLPRPVALKVHSSTGGQDSTADHRFRREADTIAGLAHPNIVTIYSRGSEAGRSWMAMQFIDGTDVASELRSGAVELERAVQILIDIAGALDYAHRTGVVHRDIKPANILLTRMKPEQALLADFGIATHLHDQTVLTRTGDLIASFQYAAPERFDSHIRIDQQSDVYSLGCTFHHMLTGRLPFDGTTSQQLMHDHMFRPVPRPSTHNPSVPPAFDTVIARALAKHPDQRYPRLRHTGRRRTHSAGRRTNTNELANLHCLHHALDSAIETAPRTHCMAHHENSARATGTCPTAELVEGPMAGRSDTAGRAARSGIRRYRQNAHNTRRGDGLHRSGPCRTVRTRISHRAHRTDRDRVRVAQRADHRGGPRWSGGTVRTLRPRLRRDEEELGASTGDQELTDTAPRRLTSHQSVGTLRASLTSCCRIASREWSPTRSARPHRAAVS